MGEASESPAGWRRVQDLFHRARELAPAERTAFLERHCSGDASLLEEVRGLLEEALSEPSLPPAPPGAGPRGEDLSGTRLGHYELARIVGAGSMGVIYEARQAYVERSVALKILRGREDFLDGGGTPEAYERMSRRFFAEAAVLGLLDHPGIVPIHEMQREGGRSYFTMRLVRGDDFRAILARVHAGPEGPAEARGWTLPRALHVVLRVCETMAFAHDRGVLHRDLKPSHVMVGGFGEVYIVDWGLAKLPGQAEQRDLRLREEPEASATGSLVPAPLRTVEGDVIGTPAYMPPEQARGELGKLDARSDVYAVGALLYHLLAGHPPHVAEHERGVSARRVLERVREGPPAPLRRLAPALPSALVSICEKAMQRDPDGRYASMEALADDLRAYLENRVVRAHRTGALIELAKWLQRNALLAGACALALLVGAGWAVSVVAKNRALRAAVEETARERDHARAESRLSEATSRFLTEVFRTVHPQQSQGETVSMRDALDLAAASVADYASEPRVQAAVRHTLGVAYYHLGRHAQAEEHLAFALATLERELGERHAQTIEAMGDYAAVLRELARYEQAEPLLRRSLALGSELRGAGDPLTLRATGNLCQLLLDRGEPEEGLVLATHLLELQRTTLGDDSPELVPTYELLGALHDARGDAQQAERFVRLEYELARALHGAEHSATLLAAQNLAAILSGMGRNDEALELSMGAVARLAEVFGERHREVLVARGNLSLYLIEGGSLDDGLVLLRETLAMQQEVLGPEHPETLLSCFNLASSLRSAGREAEALPHYRSLYAHHRSRWDPAARDLGVILVGLADCLLHEGELDEAVDVLRALLAVHDAAPESTRATAAETAQRLAECYEALGRRDELAELRASRAAAFARGD